MARDIDTMREVLMTVDVSGAPAQYGSFRHIDADGAAYLKDDGAMRRGDARALGARPGGGR